MHGVIHRDGVYRQSQFIRYSAAFAYLLFGTAGVLLLASPLLHQVYQDSGEWMAWFLVVGGYACALGNFTRYWAGEFVGCPLLAMGFGVLGAEAWLVTHEQAPLIAAANLAVLLGLGALTMIRWRMVLGVYRFVHAVALAEKDRDDHDAQ